MRLIAPQYVKPYVKSQKNDAADAAAICEAASRPHMRFVPVKSKFSMELDMANLSEIQEFDATMASFHPAAGSDVLSPIVVAEGAPLTPTSAVPAPAPKSFLSSILGPSGTMKK